jgi:hypothetical protein
MPLAPFVFSAKTLTFVESDLVDAVVRRVGEIHLAPLTADHRSRDGPR